jgi:hypothetical protein
VIVWASVTSTVPVNPDIAVTAGEKAYAGNAAEAMNPAVTLITIADLSVLFLRKGVFLRPVIEEALVTWLTEPRPENLRASFASCFWSLRCALA